MTKTCKIILKDEVNCKIELDDPVIKRKLVKELSFFLQYARHLMAYKLGQWDGMKHYCDVGGRTYVNLLDRLLPILIKEGYEIDVEDLRTAHKFDFDLVAETEYAHIRWPESHVKAGEPIMIRDHQVSAINDFLLNTHGLGEISTGAGKAQPLDSLIKVPHGWKRMGDIAVGDIITGADGKPANVIGVFPQGKLYVYEVTFGDGRSARSCGDHIWNVKTQADQADWEQMSLYEVKAKLGVGNVYVPLCVSSNDEPVELPFAPYVFGAMLAGAEIFNGDQHLNSLSMIGIDLNDMGHVSLPEQYKNASHDQRISVLRGILDAGGDVVGSGVEYSSRSTALVGDVAYLARSLGLRATILNGSTVKIEGPNCKDLFRLDAKISQVSTGVAEWHAHNAITHIELVGAEDCQCIMVDNADHLYVTDDFVVTHNTIITATLSQKAEKYGRTFVIVPNVDLVLQTKRDYELIGLDVGVYYGDKKEIGRTHTICTWQSLEALDKKEDPDHSLSEVTSGCVAVIVDECFHGDSLVKTPGGTKKIKDIAIGDKVINYSEATREFKEDVVVDVYRNMINSETEKMFALLMDTGVTIQVTGNHKFLTSNRGWVRADALDRDDDIISFE